MRADHAEHLRRHQQMVLDAIREHTLAHGWPPSQRAIAEITGINLQRVNTTLKTLVEQGLIELGPHPREVRIVGSVMTIPEVRV